MTLGNLYAKSYFYGVTESMMILPIINYQLPNLLKYILDQNVQGAKTSTKIERKVL